MCFGTVLLYLWFLLAEFDKLYVLGPLLHIVVPLLTWNDMGTRGIFLGKSTSGLVLLPKYPCDIGCLYWLIGIVYLLLGLLLIQWTSCFNLHYDGVVCFGIICWSFSTWVFWIWELLIQFFIVLFEFFWFIITWYIVAGIASVRCLTTLMT